MADKVLISEKALAVLMLTGESMLVSIHTARCFGEAVPVPDEMIIDVIAAVVEAQRMLDALDHPTVSARAGRA